VILDEVTDARAAWSGVVAAGQVLRIIDLGGNQAVDCLVYNAPGSELRSNEGAVLMTVTESTCAFHDTIGGACSRESNALRYGHHIRHQHACVDNFLAEGSKHGLGKRDLVSNINWFMNVQVGPDGTLGIVDGISAPGLYVDVRAEMDVLVLISNCPQINNPCNAFDPTPIRVQVFEAR